VLLSIFIYFLFRDPPLRSLPCPGCGHDRPVPHWSLYVAPAPVHNMLHNISRGGIVDPMGEARRSCAAGDRSCVEESSARSIHAYAKYDLGSRSWGRESWTLRPRTGIHIWGAGGGIRDLGLVLSYMASEVWAMQSGIRGPEYGM
jgi:hypothetical protein